MRNKNMKPMQTNCAVETMRQTPLNKPATISPFLPMEGRTFRFISLTLLLMCLAAMSTPTRGASTWTGSGPGTATVVSDGSILNPQFQYYLSGLATRFDQMWDFRTTAEADGSETLPYCWRGFHAYFAVTAQLNAYVTHLGVTTFTPLVNEGPVGCCSPPSGGFHYTGTVTLNVQTGDTYASSLAGVIMTLSRGCWEPSRCSARMHRPAMRAARTTSPWEQLRSNLTGPVRPTRITIS